MVNTQNRYKKLETQKFGRLLVIERDWGKTSPQNGWKVYWKCQCDCGNTVSVRSEHLGAGKHTQSCGCLQKEKASINGKKKTLPNGEYARRTLFLQYKTRAKKLGLTFELTRDIFNKMIDGNCFYCDALPSNKYIHRKNKTNVLIYNGIDRKDSTKGYTLDNIVTCCHQCNYAKLDFTFDEFVTWVEKTYHHLKELKLCKT